MKVDKQVIAVTFFLKLLLFITPLTYCQEVSLKNFLPKHTLQDQIIHHVAYTLEYNEQYEQAEWVCYLLTKDRVFGTVNRTDNFRSDPLVETGSATLADYKGSGYDRGHLAPAADMKWSEQVMSESFFMSNMSPQKPGFNRGIWKNLESLIRTCAVENEEIYIVTGPVLKGALSTIGQNEVAVPEYYYKVILDYKEPELKGIGFIMPNESLKLPLQNYTVTIDSVENFTGIDFFPVLSDEIEEKIESTLEVDKWTFEAKRSTTSKESLSKSIQCKGITKDGTRCKRMTTNPNGYCWQHQAQAGII